MAGIVFYHEEEHVDVCCNEHSMMLWNYALQAGGSDMTSMIVLNRTKNSLMTPNSKISFEDRKETDGDLTFLHGSVAYFVPPSDKRVTTDLWNFEHDVDWYFFGPAQTFYFEKRSFDFVVTIPIPVQYHAIHAASVVMAHRHYRKANGSNS